MAEEVKIQYPELEKGSDIVLFRKSKKARYIRISIDTDLKVKVTLPHRASFKTAAKFFQDKIIWVQNSLVRMQKKQLASSSNTQNIKKELSAEAFLTKNQYLITKCKALAEEHNFTIGQITIRRQKRIWGSCSGKNNISLNANLVFLDYDLIDYVICHELVHTKVKDHSRRFWDKLEELLPGAKFLNKKLKNYQPNFFLK